MHKHGIFLCAVLLLFAMTSTLRAQARPVTTADPIREVFVPFEDLNVLLEGQTQRVYLSRREYEDLLAKAKQKPPVHVPHQVRMLSAQYDISIEEGRALIQGSIEIDVLADGLQALPLDLTGVAVRSATLDDTAAPIGARDGQQPVLFVEGPGPHRLVLEMVTPLETSAAQQSLHFQVPTPAATRFALVVPGNVEIKAGASVIQRKIDDAAGVTRFEFVPPRGAVSLVMSLNNRLLRSQRVVVARSVIVAEVTEAYERLHATVSLGILHGAVDRFRFVVPQGFEVTEVATPLLARWNLDSADEQHILDVTLREATTETVVLNVSATRTPARLQAWTFPRLETLDAEGQVAVVGLLVEDRLQASALEPAGLIPIDTAVLSGALPASVFQAEPGAPQVRTVASYYAPQASYQLQAQFDKPPGVLRVTTSMLLLLKERGLEVQGGFTVVPDKEKRFGFDFLAPPGWNVTELTLADGTPLPLEKYAAAEQGSRVHVRLPQGVAPGEQLTISFSALNTPPNWLDDWSETTAKFPIFAVIGATQDSGAIAVIALDDQVVRPESPNNITPLDDKEKSKYGLSDVSTSLAYRYDSQPYALGLSIERTPPRITARTFSFLRVEREALIAHYEIVYDVQQARTGRLTFQLPAGTPGEIAIRGLDDTVIKEYVGEVVDGQRHWNAHLAERRSGVIRLAVDFQDRLEAEPKDLALPIIRAGGVQYQSGIVAVEGSAELDVQVVTHPRRVDIGELVDAEYQPGRRLLGAFGFVGDTAEVLIDVFRRPAHGLPPAIVERAEMVTLVSINGLSETACRYLLRTKAQYVEVRLPEQAKLWSAFLDGKPATPQREGQSLLLSLPAADAGIARDLQIVYEEPVNMVSLVGDVELAAPRLLLREQAGTEASEVPIADLKWHLHLPDAYYVSRSHGSVFSDQRTLRRMPSSTVAGVLYYLLGGVNLFYNRGVPGVGIAARESDRAYFEFAPSAAAPSEGKVEQAQREPAGLDVMNETADMPMELRATLSDEAAAPAFSTMPVPETPPMVAAPQLAPPAQPMPPAIVQKDIQEGRGKWVLKGLRSLPIELEQHTIDDPVTFHSLGVEPRLTATLVNQQRFHLLAWGVALLVGLRGLGLSNRPVGEKARFVISVLILSLLLPLLLQITFDLGDELAATFDGAFYVACLLVPYYLLAGLVKRIRCRITAQSSRPVVTTASAVIALLLAASAALAEPATGEAMVVVPLAAPLPPVKIPDNAVIVPYDKIPFDEQDTKDEAKTEKLLVPYATYVELWNRAYPDKRQQTSPPPAAYALAGAALQTTLAGEDYLIVSGHLDIDVFVEEAVTIPLPLAGGVLAQATLDGEPARLSVLQVNEPVNGAPNMPAQAAQPQADQVQQQVAQVPFDPQADEPAEAFVVLHTMGQGRKHFEFAVRLKLARQGGWRIAQGRLPAAPATSLSIQVPQAQTDVRLGAVQDRASYETKQNNEQIETALTADGRLSIQWRPQVAEGEIDQSLTARSNAVLDVQEDGLHAVWQVTLEFRRTRRESFTLTVPADYLVETVAGDNVRGWQTKPNAGRQQLDVTLLKAAGDQQTLTIALSRRGAVGEGDLSTFEVPAVTVGDAALHQGQLIIRRSPLLDVRTADAAGLSRADAPDLSQPPPARRTGNSQNAVPVPSSTSGTVAEVLRIADEGDQSPLKLRPFQVYQFATESFRLVLSAAPVVPSASADLQTVLKIAQRELTLESRINLHVQDRPVYRVEIDVPQTLKFEQVSAPGSFQWVTAEQDDHQRLSIYLTAGQQGDFSVLIRGSIARDGTAATVPVPKLSVVNVERQQGDLVVQADPAYDVRAEQLRSCESILLDRVRGWLSDQQYRLARLALHYRSPDYDAVLRTTPRQPLVQGYSISNVKVTSRAIEETVLLNFTIENAGIRELSFLLPASLRDARIDAPMLRQKTVTPIADQPDVVRVRLELQDEIIGQFRVLVEEDHLLTPGDHQVPIPTLETGRTDQRYLALENIGADELVIQQQQGVEVLGRQQSAWRKLADILGGNMTTAYIVRDAAQQPLLAFTTKDRAAVETAGARIGWAETRLVLDGHGAYRAVQQFRVDNRTEQFLEVELPHGAELWTVAVADQPVKPTEVPDGVTGRHVRIPLVKTAEGERDYLVTLKYGGHIESPGRLRSVRFPLIRTLNVSVELSQVRLFLPETHQWFDFGGSMRQVHDPRELEAGYVRYLTNTINKLSEALQSSNTFSRIRAANNLKQLGLATHSYRTSEHYDTNDLLQQEYAANATAFSLAEQQIETQSLDAGIVRSEDNRGRLAELFKEQQNTRAKDVVQDVGVNFDFQQQPLVTASDATKEFDDQWLRRNQLENPLQPEQSEAGARVQFEGGKKAAQPGKPQSQSMTVTGQPQAPQLSQGKAKAELDALEEQKKAAAIERERFAGDVRQQAQRYQERYGQQPATPDGSMTFSDINGTLATPPPMAWAQGVTNGEAIQAAASGPAGPPTSAFVSLDVALVERGVPYYFTTPRGDVEITARAIDDGQWHSILRIGGVLLAIGILMLLYYFARRLPAAMLQSRSIAVLLLIAGLLSLISGIFPILGLIATITGITLLIRRLWRPRQPQTAR